MLAFVYEPKKLPRVLPPDDVLRMLEVAPTPKSKAMLGVAYGAGLRAMEVVSLKVAGRNRHRANCSDRRQTSRGFLLLRLPDAGPRARGQTSGGPASGTL